MKAPSRVDFYAFFLPAEMERGARKAHVRDPRNVIK